MGISLQLPEGSPWRTVARVCIILLAEAAVITMLRDAPLLFQAATVVIAVLALIVLEAEAKVDGRTFAMLIGGLGLVYLGFVGYAVHHAYQAIAIDRKLQDLRGDGLAIEQRARAVGGMTASEYADWQKQTERWRGETAQYVQATVGEAAKNRFLSTAGRSSLGYSTTEPFNSELNQMDWLGKNLQDIIDSRRR